MKEKILSYFEIEELNTMVECEVLVGFITFISMAYILFVNPTVLGASEMDEGAVSTAAALADAIDCILMGVLVRYPVGTAPVLGINAFLVYSVCLGVGIPWEITLAGALVASLIFILITALELWEMVIDAIPAGLKYAISNSIGPFIALLGLSEGGVIASNEPTLVGLGLLNVGSTWLTILGLVVTAILPVRRAPGDIFIGMTVTTILGPVTGLIPMPSEIAAATPSLEPTFLIALKYVGDINSLQIWIVVLTFLFVTFFNTAGTLIGLANQAGFMKDNKMPHVGKTLTSDSTTMPAGSLFDTSPADAFIESLAGITVGGRSGITAITTGIFLLLDSFFSPLLSVVVSQVTAPALIVVGVLMIQSLRQVEWGGLEVAIPSFLVLISVPLTYNTSDGIVLGLIFYPTTILAAKRGKEISPIMYGLSFIFMGFMWILNAK